MRFAFIDAERAVSVEIPLRIYCRVLHVTRAGYWAWKRRKPGHRLCEDQRMGDHIEKIFDESGESYGSHRMHQHLQKESFIVGRRRVARLMRDRGLFAQIPKKYVKTTDSNHNNPVAPNVLDRQFHVCEPNTLWLTDISYIPTTQGFLYIAAIMDAFSRRVIGYAIDDHMRVDLCESALAMALRNRCVTQGLMHHSDRGSQYTSGSYQDTLKKLGIVCSMSRRAQCWDNAMMESFFGRLKNEHLYKLPLRSKQDTKIRTQRWIELWYNNRRVHTSLGGLSPMEFEEMYWQEQRTKAETKIAA
jgi:transposase InsO family protein